MKQHESLIRTARLLCSPPNDVHAELKANAERPRHERLGESNKELEAALLARKEPLIDITLAQYGTDEKIVAEIFSRTSDASDLVTIGIRVACLSNEVVGGFWNRFPASVIGEDETTRILANEDERDAAALLANPRVDDELLEDLFARKGRFAELPELRWLRLVLLASGNKRLVTCEDSADGPDMGHYGIQKSILQLIREAPTTPVAVQIIYQLLSNLDPWQTHGDSN